MDSRFYSLVHTETVPSTDGTYETVFSGYKPKYGHPMCLFSSVDGLPIALLELRYQNKQLYDSAYNTFVTELPSNGSDKQSFQAIATKDSEAIEFVITNASDNYINFNLMKCDEKVVTVNPKGLNEINELRPYESFAVKSDQTIGNRIIKLTANVNSDGRQTKLKDEVNDSSEKVGSYLFLSIVPKLGTTLCDRFAETFWKPVDYFVVKTTKTIQTNNAYIVKGVTQHSDTSNMLLLDSNDQSERLFRSSANSRHSGFKYSRFDRSADNALTQESAYQQYSSTNMPNLLPLNNTSERRESNKNIQKNIKCLAPKIQRGGSPQIHHQAKNESFSLNTIHVDDLEEEEDYVEDLEGFNLNDAVMESKVANISVGDEVIQVNSTQTDIMYDYDKISKPCILGLSVMQGFKLKVLSDDQIKTELTDLIKRYIGNAYAELISQMKVYNSDTCIICLTEQPNVLFYRCGHICIDKACMTKMDRCPICRQNIAASIPYINNNNINNNIQVKKEVASTN